MAPGSRLPAPAEHALELQFLVDAISHDGDGRNADGTPNLKTGSHG